PQQQYQYGLQELELFGEVKRAAGVNFICRGGAVRRRTTFDDVGDEEIGAFKSSAAKDTVKWGSSVASTMAKASLRRAKNFFVSLGCSSSTQLRFRNSIATAYSSRHSSRWSKSVSWLCLGLKPGDNWSRSAPSLWDSSKERRPFRKAFVTAFSSLGVSSTSPRVITAFEQRIRGKNSGLVLCRERKRCSFTSKMKPWWSVHTNDERRRFRGRDKTWS